MVGVIAVDWKALTFEKIMSPAKGGKPGVPVDVMVLVRHAERGKKGGFIRKVACAASAGTIGGTNLQPLLGQLKSPWLEVSHPYSHHGWGFKERTRRHMDRKGELQTSPRYILPSCVGRQERCGAQAPLNPLGHPAILVFALYTIEDLKQRGI